MKIIRKKDARVEWSEVGTLNLKSFLKKVFVYSKGDGEAKIWWHPTKQFSSHNIRIIAIFIRYLIGFLLLIYSFNYPQLFIYLFILIIFYLIYPILKWKSVIKGKIALLLLPVIQILTDITSMYGFITGTISINGKEG